MEAQRILAEAKAGADRAHRKLLTASKWYLTICVADVVIRLLFIGGLPIIGAACLAAAAANLAAAQAVSILSIRILLAKAPDTGEGEATNEPPHQTR